MMLAPLLVCSLLMLDPASLRTWSSEQPITGELVAVSAQGIELRASGDLIPERIAWYEFRSIEPDDPQIQRYQTQAIAAWRAHARRARGDLPGALPVYESLRDQYLWQRGRQSAEVSLGLMECLIGADRRVDAIEPMLAWFVASQTHTPSGDATDPMIDAQTLLAVRLPPVFLEVAANFELSALPETDLITDRERLLHAYYQLVLRPESSRASVIDEIEQLKRSLRARDAGIILIEQMVFSQAHPDPSKRQSAIDSLSRRTKTQRDTWIEVWARLGLGAALLRDTDPMRRERGVIELLHIVTRLHKTDPGLTMLAAELASGYLESTGRAGWGRMIEHDARAIQTK